MTFCDDDLMVMFAAGVREAFDMLFERYRNPIYRFAIACIRNESDAEDIVQDVFLSVARAAELYEPRNRFRAWIFCIASNRIRSSIAKRASRQEVGWPDDSDRSVGNEPHSVSPAPDIILSRRQELLDLLNRLPHDQKLAFLLRELEGFPIEDIAKALDTSIINVRVLLHRARRRMLERGTIGGITS